MHYIAGFSGLASTGEGGTKAIAERIPGAKHFADPTGFAQHSKFVDEILESKPDFIALFGHSKGAEQALEIAADLERHRVIVDYIGIIDMTYWSRGVAGSNIKYMQEFHAAYAHAKKDETFAGKHELIELDQITGQNVGHSEAAQLQFTHDTIVNTIANLRKDTHVSDKPFYMGKGERLKDSDYKTLSYEHQIPEYLIRTIVHVEAASKGSHSSGALVFRLELHKAYKYAPKSTRNTLVNNGVAHPDYQVARRWSHANSYPHLEKLARLGGEELACMASSWGLGQVMGFNHKLLGFGSALKMVKDFAASEANQVAGMLNFIKGANLLDHFLNENWDAAAKGYNGASYRDNGYHTKLRDTANKMKALYGSEIATQPDSANDDQLPEIPPETLPELNLSEIESYLRGKIPDMDKTALHLILARFALQDFRNFGDLPPPDLLTTEGETIAQLSPASERVFSSQKSEQGTSKMTFDFINLSSKTFWVGAVNVVAGLLLFISPESGLAELAKSFVGESEPGTLISIGLGLIFGREAIAKNGSGN